MFSLVYFKEKNLDWCKNVDVGLWLILFFNSMGSEGMLQGVQKKEGQGYGQEI